MLRKLDLELLSSPVYSDSALSPASLDPTELIFGVALSCS